MKIAVSVKFGEDLHAPLDSRFGRCGLFLLVDDERGTVLRLIPNQNRDASHGAGVAATALVAKAGAAAVISGQFGPKATQGLEAAGIEMFCAPAGATAGEALQSYRDRTRTG